jgi:cob(I)alamin adenosyltransferase
MKIYTKTGDKGTTALIGGIRVPKNHIRIEAYGTVDELIAFTGVLRDYVTDTDKRQQLVQIQDHLMVIAAILATAGEVKDIKLPKLSDEDIVWIETRIDDMEEQLTPISRFVLPGGHPAVSFSHVARTVCRRAERIMITLSETATIPDILLRYMNRLSDYFFVLSRFLTARLEAEEIPWQAQLDK